MGEVEKEDVVNACGEGDEKEGRWAQRLKKGRRMKTHKKRFL
jgi:hypothetical protein